MLIKRGQRSFTYLYVDIYYNKDQRCLALVIYNTPHSLAHMVRAWLRYVVALQCVIMERDGVSNHQPRDCLLRRLYGRRSKETSNLRVTGLCAGNSSVTGEILAQRTSNAENVSIWWRHHGKLMNKTISFGVTTLLLGQSYNIPL